MLTPALRLGLVGTQHTWALALMAQQPVCERTRSGRREVVRVIYCQSLAVIHELSLHCLITASLQEFFKKLNCYLIAFFASTNL